MNLYEDKSKLKIGRVVLRINVSFFKSNIETKRFLKTITKMCQNIEGNVNNKLVDGILDLSGENSKKTCIYVGKECSVIGLFSKKIYIKKFLRIIANKAVCDKKNFLKYVEKEKMSKSCKNLNNNICISHCFPEIHENRNYLMIKNFVIEETNLNKNVKRIILN